MLGIIVCQLQPSKSTFELIKENFLFICLFVVLLYFFFISSEQKVQTVTTPQRQKALV